MTLETTKCSICGQSASTKMTTRRAWGGVPRDDDPIEVSYICERHFWRIIDRTRKDFQRLFGSDAEARCEAVTNM
jgi:hypothetical protein